jgi:GTP pyrophosphokinase/guanosine-3',5'-bis(diphosphate) 3'-pyrophosphohydrolase
MNFDYGSYQALVEEKKDALFISIKRNLSNKEVETIKLAYEVASYSHFSQKRKSGEPYITHPLEVATIVADWNLDVATIASSLLHDVVEDTSVSRDDIEQIFGLEIAELVDSVTKLEKINFETEEIAHAEYFRKVVLAMAKDIRVILIKLSDRLHNMLTLASMSPLKRHKIALETMEIYVPIANKIGLHRVHLELADESFKHLYPFRYKVLQKSVTTAQKNRRPILESILHNIRGGLKSNGIEANFVYRQRAIYNLYRRMVRRNQGFARIYDIFEVKIIVNTIRDCYLTLGVIHSLYQPLPGKFKDYIAIPKSNGYQSLHSTLMGPQGIPLQIHIRTHAMEDVAENGIISHWLKHKNDDAFFSANQRTANWIDNILDIQASSFSANDFLSSIKQDLSPIDMYVFTPKGKIIILPRGSTPLDFAYFIHSDVGNHCSLAKINNKFEKLNTKLQSGDIIEIVTNKDTEPSPEWLEIAISAKAISKIKQYLKEQKYDEDVSNGQKLINYSLSAFGSSIVVNSTALEIITKKFYPRLTVAELEHCVGVGSLSALLIAKNILNITEGKAAQIKLSNCPNLSIIQDPNCLPLPNDKVFAKISRNGEISLHKLNCKQNKSIGLDNLTFVHITNDIDRMFLSKIHVLLRNIPGTFTKFSGIIAEKNINIIELAQEVSTEDSASVTLTLGVLNLNQIEDLRDSLCEVDFVEKVHLI